jgi:hypothetical protein
MFCPYLPLATPQKAFSFESIGRNGKALCLGETVILTAEINPFISRLRKHGVKVTALHNHWLFDHPDRTGGSRKKISFAAYTRSAAADLFLS